MAHGVQRIGGVQLRDALKRRVNIPQRFPHPSLCLGVTDQLLQNRPPGAGTGPAGRQRPLAGERQPKLVVQPQKPLTIGRLVGKAQKIHGIQHNFVGEKRQVGLFKAVGHTPPLAQVHQRQRTLVVAEQHRRLPAAAPGFLKQPVDLLLAPGDAPYLNGALRPLGRPQGFGAAVAAAGHKGVGGGHDLLTGTVILLHQQHLCAGVDLLKVHQCLGVGGAEPIDALILVAYHKQVQTAPRQQPYNFVLNFGGILRFIHAKIFIPLLEIRQHRRRGPQNLQRKHHLVVVVHLPGPFQRGLVAAVQLRQVG